VNGLQLIKPSLDALPSYEDALRRGWSPDNIRLEVAAQEELARIAVDPEGFLASLDDPEAKGEPIKQLDGTTTPRLPGYRRWIWDGEVCGSIGFRWQPGTAELPPWVYGHIGYGVVPWKRSRGYATRALALMLEDARAMGLPSVELTTDDDNLPSQKTITANGGELVGRFALPGVHGDAEKLRYRIAL
jgi:predicted acetyltransferase